MAVRPYELINLSYLGNIKINTSLFPFCLLAFKNILILLFIYLRPFLFLTFLSRSASTILSFILLQLISLSLLGSSLYYILCNLIFETILAKTRVNPINVFGIFFFYLFPCFSKMIIRCANLR